MSKVQLELSEMRTIFLCYSALCFAPVSEILFTKDTLEKGLPFQAILAIGASFSFLIISSEYEILLKIFRDGNPDDKKTQFTFGMIKRKNYLIEFLTWYGIIISLFSFFMLIPWVRCFMLMNIGEISPLIKKNLINYGLLFCYISLLPGGVIWCMLKIKRCCCRKNGCY